MPRVVPFPSGATEYLQKKYGLKPYSGKHLDRLVKAGRFPAPIHVSPRRRASLISDLDDHAERLIHQSGV